MNKNIMIGIVLVIVVLLGGFLLMKNSQQPSQETAMTEESPVPTDTMAVSESPAETSGTPSATNVKEFTVTGSNFEFDPAKMTVKKGDTVKITFKSEGSLHDFVIDEFDVRTQQLGAGKEESIEFVADKSGTFEYYCSVGNHRQMGMVGTLTVQ